MTFAVGTDGGDAMGLATDRDLIAELTDQAAQGVLIICKLEGR